MQPDTLHLQALQLDLVWESPQANFQKIEELLSASPPQVDLLILPEMFPTGFSMNPKPFAENEEGPTVQWMQATAQKWDLWVLGSMIAQVEGGYTNRFLAVSPSGIEARYDKRHPFSMSGEDQHYLAGTDRIVFAYKGWRICPMVCYDLRFPVWSRNIGKEKGQEIYDLLLYVANWPEKRVSHWQTLLKARAIENQCYTVGVNRVGIDGYELKYAGSTMVVDPLGDVQEILMEKEGRVESVLNKKNLLQVREKLPFLKDAHGLPLG